MTRQERLEKAEFIVEQGKGGLGNMVKFSIIEVIAEATQDNDLAFRVFEIIRPMKAWELDELEEEVNKK